MIALNDHLEAPFVFAWTRSPARAQCRRASSRREQHGRCRPVFSKIAPTEPSPARAAFVEPFWREPHE
ncbi:hypothetical protein AB4084_29380, partial [Lysobacter sp. 2RAB21]